MAVQEGEEIDDDEKEQGTQGVRMLGGDLLLCSAAFRWGAGS